jgi:TP901 family phage tail tape measure protein
LLEYIISAVDNFSDQFNKLESRIEQSAGSFQAVGAAAMGAGLAVGGGLLYAVKKTMDFEKEMSRVGALSRATGEELAQLTQTAKELGASTIFSASEAAQGMSSLAMAGYDTNQIIAAMPGLLDTAAAAQTGLAETSDIVSNILSGFGMQASETGRIADVLTKTFTTANVDLTMLGDTMKYTAPVAKTLGVSLEDAATAAGILGNAGIQGTMAGTGLSGILNRLSAQPTDVRKALDKMNVSVFDTAGNFVGLEESIRRLESGMRGYTQQQKAAALVALAGQEHVKTLSILLDNGADAFGTYASEIENSLGSAQAVAEQQTDNLWGAVENLSGAFDSLILAVGSPLQDPLRRVAEIITDLIDKFNGLNPETQKMVSYVLVAAAGLGVFGGAMLLIVGFLPQIIAGLKMVGAVLLTLVRFTPIGLIATALALATLYALNPEKFMQTLETMKQKLSEVFERVMAALPENVREPIEKVVGVFKRLVDWGKENWPAFRDTIMNAFSAVWGFVGPIISDLVIFFTEQFNKIIAWVDSNLPLFRDAFQKISDFLVGLFNFLWPLLKAVVLDAIESIKRVISGGLDVVMGIIQFFAALITGDWGKLWDAVKLIFTGAWDLIIGLLELFLIGKIIKAVKVFGGLFKKAFDDLIVWFKGLWDKSLKFLNTAVDDTFKWVIDRLKSFTKLFKDGFISLWDDVKKLWSEALAWVNKTTGGKFDEIMAYLKGLPAKFRTIGSDIINGLKNGINDAATNAINAAKELASKVKNAVSEFFKIKSPSRVMMEMGGFFTEGFTKGITGNLREAVAAAGTLSSATIGAMNAKSSTLSPVSSGRGDSQTYITVNVSGQDFSDPSFIERISHRIGREIAFQTGGKR